MGRPRYPLHVTKPSKPNDADTTATPTFDDAMNQVEAIVARIESGEVGLEQSLAEYEKGVQLLKQCRDILQRVEQKIEDLTGQMEKKS